MTLEEYRNSMLPSDRPLFDNFVDIGIRKTIFALLDADVDDSVIQHVVTKHWNLSLNEFNNYLIDAKKEIALFLIRQHLTFQGYNSSEVDKVISSHMIGIHLSHNHELLKLWKNPEKILKSIQQNKKSKGC